MDESNGNVAVTIFKYMTYSNVTIGVFKGELASKIISNSTSGNTYNVDKRSTLKPEDYPAADSGSGGA